MMEPALQASDLLCTQGYFGLLGNVLAYAAQANHFEDVELVRTDNMDGKRSLDNRMF